MAVGSQQPSVRHPVFSKCILFQHVPTITRLSAEYQTVVSVSISISIQSPVSEAIYQQVSGVANIPVTVNTSGVPAGGGVEFVLDAGTAGEVDVKNYTYPYAQTFKNVPLGEHTLDAYVVNSTGGRTSAHDQQTRIGVGEIIVAFGGDSAAGEYDDITSDDYSADGRNGPYTNPTTKLQYGGFEPILNDMLTEIRGYPHTVINAGADAERSSGGVNLPTVDATSWNQMWLAQDDVLLPTTRVVDPKSRYNDDLTGVMTEPGQITQVGDVTPPVVLYAISPAEPDGTDGVYNTVPTITLSATDTTGLPVVSITYKWDSGSNTVYSAPFRAPTGVHTLYYYATDASGNTSSVQSKVINLSTTAK